MTTREKINEIRLLWDYEQEIEQSPASLAMAGVVFFTELARILPTTSGPDRVLVATVGRPIRSTLLSYGIDPTR